VTRACVLPILHSMITNTKMRFRRRRKVCLQVVFIVADCKLAVKKREGELYREIIWVYAIELSEVSVLEWSTAACFSVASSEDILCKQACL